MPPHNTSFFSDLFAIDKLQRHKHTCVSSFMLCYILYVHVFAQNSKLKQLFIIFFAHPCDVRALQTWIAATGGHVLPRGICFYFVFLQLLSLLLLWYTGSACAVVNWKRLEYAAKYVSAVFRSKTLCLCRCGLSATVSAYTRHCEHIGAGRDLLTFKCYYFLCGVCLSTNKF